MIISHKHQFIIINIPKTGTSSIISALRKSKISIDIIGGPIDQKYYLHDSASSVKHKLLASGFDWNNYASYARVRHPWRRYVSYFLWTHKHIKYCADNPDTINEIDKNVLKNIVTIRDKYNHCDKKIFKYYINHIANQSYYLLEHNQCIVNKVDQFENLKNDFKAFCNSLNIPNIELLHNNKNKDYNYKDFYDQELIDRVADKEKYIIDKWGYEY